MSAPTLTLPTELWLRVVNCLRKPIVYYSGDACCGGAFRPSPGSAFGVGPLPRPADKDCVALASTCSHFRQLLLDEVAFGELHVCLRGGQLVRHSGGRYPAFPIHDRLTYRELSTAPFGDGTRRLTLSLFVYEGLTYAQANQQALDATTDAAADAILARVPNLVALEVHVRVTHSGNSYPVSEKLARAMSALPSLVDLSFSGCHLPDIPSLHFPHVRRIQTDHVITSFDPFPNLRELRNDQHWLEQDAYHIPVDVFRKLEVLHYCPPDNTEAIDWFPEDCEVRRLLQLRLLRLKLTSQGTASFRWAGREPDPTTRARLATYDGRGLHRACHRRPRVATNTRIRLLCDLPQTYSIRQDPGACKTCIS